ncbi:MAG: hypothetical protein WHU94_04595 [Thermogemmata sp.]|uniref:Uncharacterized protein n=1 Tax=Thermogemmata fonticola TaxID=2755323 RepID=A0A7V8VD94_9BACT|nr:hypothetical protein [Thermogemmata fonticola]MBA2225826.1 hypothetical protein [Thermogemmata fonticola]MCX8139850.1 hypothetical protein [Gemmataceae bacterium]
MALRRSWAGLGWPRYEERSAATFADQGKAGHRLQHLVGVTAVRTTETNDARAHDDPPLGFLIL